MVRCLAVRRRAGAALTAAVLAAAVAPACARDHEVRLLLGPDENTLTQGLTCRDASGQLLSARALVQGRLRFNVVVDLLDLGGDVPGCRGEELLTWCNERGCAPVLVADGRFCAPIDLDASQSMTAVVDEIYRQLAAAGTVVRDGPDGPVLVRAVATTAPCAALTSAAGGAYPPFDLADVFGCAYSCPVVLDDVDEVQLSLDTLSDRCSAEVFACAAGPGQ